MCTDCRKIEALLPLLSNGTISASDRDAVERHLRECSACSRMYADLQPLFAAAKTRDPADSGNHPADLELYDLIFRPADMSDKKRTEIEHHAASCEECAELIELLGRLPAQPADLLNEHTAPVLTKIDQGFTTQPVESIPPSATRQSHRLIYVLAAAVVVLIAAGLVMSPLLRHWAGLTTQTTAIIRADLPETMRSSAAATPDFVIPTPASELALACPVRPEAGHAYSFRLKESGSVAIIKSWDRFDRFDSAGRFVDTIQLAPGNYVLQMNDILDNDTITVDHAFRVTLRTD